ncbi:hopanoid biosynthesis-associated protein HpnK [bacterium]|nr:hopanoid biosynthesis-associated protein HpnK [bacterium]
MFRKLLIINADDFGASNGVNTAVAHVRREGLITSASIMVTGDAFDKAVIIAKNDPQLAVGLHLALSNARSMLDRKYIPDIVDKCGRFGDNPAACACKYYFSRRAKAQIRSEVEAQFDAFAQTGLPLSHVDGHQHLHMHPAVLPTVIEMAKQYGAHGIRLPHDPLMVNMQVDRTRLVLKIVTAIGHGYLAWMGENTLRECGLSTCEMSIGAMMSGDMKIDHVIGMLGRIRAQSVEIFFHPCASERTDPQGPNQGDMQTLLDARLKEYVIANGYVPATYADLKPEVER